MFENVDGRTDDGRTTDARVTGILIVHLGAFGSGELIIPFKLTRTVSLTGLGKRFLAKRLIYPHILHVH